MWIFKTYVPLVLLLAVLVASDGGHRHSHRRGGRRGRLGRNQRHRGGRAGLDSAADEPSAGGGVDFTGCEMQDDGMCCVMREEEIQTLEKDPILECTHKEVEKCHYTYVTEFTPSQEEVCEENFEKKCQITFKQMAITETLKKCYKPLMKTCGNEAAPSRVKRQLPGYGDSQDDSLAGAQNQQCKTFYESSCTTKYVEKQPNKFVGDTTCEKLPVELCGQGCTVEEGPEECHDKEVDTLVDVPEEVCDLNPQKTCRFQTKLVPRLKPTHECTIIPQEVCQLRFSNPRQEPKAFMSKWCIDPEAEPVPDQTYDESNAGDDPLGPDTDDGSLPDTLYGAPGAGAGADYAGPSDYEDYGDDLAPPPLDDEAYEQAESSYDSPVYDVNTAAAPIAQNYDVPSDSDYEDQGAGQPDNLYEAPVQQPPPRRNGNGGGPRRNGGQNRRRGQNNRRRPQNPQTLYGAPLAEYGAAAAAAAQAALPSYGFSDDLPSYGNRRSSASNLVPVYVPSSGTGRYNRRPRYYYV